MRKKCEKLKTLLKELFQLDQPDLDFGAAKALHRRVRAIPPDTWGPPGQAGFDHRKTLSAGTAKLILTIAETRPVAHIHPNFGGW